MDAYCITLEGNEYSERVAERCIATAQKTGGITVKPFKAVAADDAVATLHKRGLRWTWGVRGGGLVHHSYGGNMEARIGCALSHYMLWQRCAAEGPLLILEHDAVFLRPFVPFEFLSACMINDPARATPRGDWWHDKMVKRGPGVYPKTEIFHNGRPDGLAGNSAYVLQPEAALLLISLVQELGMWPNDAILCRQLVPDLEEHYPFITEVQAERSTI